MKRKWRGKKKKTEMTLGGNYSVPTHTHTKKKKAKMCQKRVAQEQLQDIILIKQREKSGSIEKKSLQQKKKSLDLAFHIPLPLSAFLPPSFFFFFTVSATVFLYSFASKRFTLACRSSSSFSDLSRFLK